MADEKPLQRLHVLMLKPDVGQIEDALRDRRGLQRFEVSGGLNFTGALFVAAPSRTAPPWLQFVQTGVTGQIGALRNRTNSAVLLIAKGSSLFALTFGHGRYLLDPDRVVDDFGLRVALNGLKPDSLRSMDSLLIEEQTIHVKRQTSRASAVDAFGIDVGRDILRAVTGTPRQETGLHALSGNEGTVAIAARVDFDELGNTCSALRRVYEKDTYRQDFGWVDNVRRVKNSDELNMLEERLVKHLRKKDRGGASLAIPEMVDWMEFDGYVLPRSGGQVVDELDIGGYLAAVKQLGEVDIERLKKDKVQMKRVSFPETPLEWPLFRCLLFETKVQKKRYVLSSGEWYRIAGTLVEEVNDDVRIIPIASRQLPHVNRIGGRVEKEGDYNERVAGGDPGLSLLDRKLVRCRGAATLIEACDLVSETGELIHVKPRTGSSTLSHLFWQARVSAEALLGDEQFRTEVRRKLADQNPAWIDRFPQDRPNPSSHEIVFALLGTNEQRVADGLPFFSQLTLSRTSRYLRSTGFKVSQLGVPVSDL